MSQSLIQEAKPVFYEGILVILIGLIIIYNITATDISFHGNYVGKLIEICHPQNQSPECTEFREFLNLPSDAQMQLGDPYWQELARQAFFIGITMFLIRISFAFILHKAHMQKIRSSSFMMAILYGVVGYVLFLGGVLDTLYFVFQAQAIPSDLDWLNSAGLFQYTKTLTGDKSLVESSDLFLTNILSFAIIGIVLTITMVFFKESGLKKAIA